MKNTRYKICITGALDTIDVGLDTLEKAKHIGRAVAKRGHFLVTGSHHGFPMFSAIGAKESGGDVIYFSPASKIEEHREIYRLDSDHADIVIYTGFGHVGNQIFLSRSADAFIIGFGKVDAVSEFNLALKAGKPIGILKGDFETDESIKKVLGGHPRSHQPIIFEDDPDKLVEKLLEMVIRQ